MAGGDRQAIQRTMIALFRANPEAFNGNINQLHAGAILRVPSVGRGRGHLVRRGRERGRPAERGLACRRRRPGVRPAEARDSAGRRGRGGRGAGTERARRIADRFARKGHLRAEAPARAAEPGTRGPAEEAGRRARRGRGCEAAPRPQPAPAEPGAASRRDGRRARRRRGEARCAAAGGSQAEAREETEAGTRRPTRARRSSTR